MKSFNEYHPELKDNEEFLLNATQVDYDNLSKALPVRYEKLRFGKVCYASNGSAIRDDLGIKPLFGTLKKSSLDTINLLVYTKSSIMQMKKIIVNDNQKLDAFGDPIIIGNTYAYKRYPLMTKIVIVTGLGSPVYIDVNTIKEIRFHERINEHSEWTQEIEFCYKQDIEYRKKGGYVDTAFNGIAGEKYIQASINRVKPHFLIPIK